MHYAIRVGLQFLEFDELPKKERPPRKIWFDTEKLEEHFRVVEKRREEELKNPDKNEDDVVQNEAAKDLLID